MVGLRNISRAAFGVVVLGAGASAGCFASGMRARSDAARAAWSRAAGSRGDLSAHRWLRGVERLDGQQRQPTRWRTSFSPSDTGIGLSLLRVQIKPERQPRRSSATAQKAVARGAKVWAAPWSPPAEWKRTTTMTTNGGSLLPEHRQDWADRLATFAASMASQGIPLVAISAQNEPNYAHGDDGTTCRLGTRLQADMVTFVRDFLGPALAAHGQAVPVMAPETQGWNQLQGVRQPDHGRPGGGRDHGAARDAQLRGHAVRVLRGVERRQGHLGDGGLGQRQDGRSRNRFGIARRRHDSRQPHSGQRQRLALLVVAAGER